MAQENGRALFAGIELPTVSLCHKIKGVKEMFTRKIVIKLLTLSIMLSGLGFIVTDKPVGAEKAPATVCRVCIQGFPGYPKGIWRYCQWEVPNGTACPAAPPSDDYCIFSNPYCDPI